VPLSLNSLLCFVFRTSRHCVKVELLSPRWRIISAILTDTAVQTKDHINPMALSADAPLPPYHPPIRPDDAVQKKHHAHCTAQGLALQ